MPSKINKKLPIDIDKPDEQINYWHRIEVPAGTVLIREGEIAKKIFLIEKGCLRAWINNDSKDITFQFFFENEAVSASESLRKTIPSFFTLETVEDCVLLRIHKKNWQLLVNNMSNVPGTREKGIDAMLEKQYSYMKQLVSFLNDSPEQRYLNLLKEKPHILKRVPLQYIATYLGVTPVSLSRIRKRITKKKLLQGAKD